MNILNAKVDLALYEILKVLNCFKGEIFEDNVPLLCYASISQIVLDNEVL